MYQTAVTCGKYYKNEASEGTSEPECSIEELINFLKRKKLFEEVG